MKIFFRAPDIGRDYNIFDKTCKSLENSLKLLVENVNVKVTIFYL